jgi:hypothetical protein
MSSQIFKQAIPNALLFEFLDNTSIKTEKKYIFNKIAYKKGCMDENLEENNKLIEDFLNECKPYYFASKHKYLNRKITYNMLTTILRQICNHNKITYTSQIKYDKSTYDIEYYIFYT